VRRCLRLQNGIPFCFLLRFVHFGFLAELDVTSRTQISSYFFEKRLTTKGIWKLEKSPLEVIL
jgi:hypothetical protein